MLYADFELANNHYSQTLVCKVPLLARALGLKAEISIYAKRARDDMVSSIQFRADVIYHYRLPFELQCWVDTQFKGFVELSSLLINVEQFGFCKMV